MLEAYGKALGKKWADIEKRLKEGESRFPPPQIVYSDRLVDSFRILILESMISSIADDISPYERSKARYDRIAHAPIFYILSKALVLTGCWNVYWLEYFLH